MKRVIFVGDTSSPKNLDKNVAFLGTKSYDVLKEWISFLNINEYALVNSDHFSFYDLIHNADSNDYRVICLGKVATKEVKKYLSDHRFMFSMQHPSGLNRKLNDKKFIKQELEKCKKWLNEV